MKQLIKKLWLWCLGLVWTLHGLAQPNISRIEYYTDTDPGYGNATAISYSGTNDISTSFTINLAPLSAGVHITGVRSKDANGAWSVDNKWIFLKPYTSSGSQTTPNISRIEYFVDNDPGYGNATNVPFTGTADVSTSFNINITSLTQGVHIVGVRTLDANGAWSIDNKYIFLKPYSSLASQAVPNINRVEYFVDTDPGYGNATGVTITPGQDLSNISFTASITSLTEGVHIIGIRSRDANGAWSHDNKWIFLKPYSSSGSQSVPNINRVEYFVDTDPGYGNGTTVLLTPAQDLANLGFTINMSPLTEGVHIVGVRSKDANGAWSIDNKWLFLKPYISQIIAPRIVSAIEYYMDTDPGYGKGKPVAITPSGQIANLNLYANITGITAGKHKLYFRSKDDKQAWSMNYVDSFTVASPVAAPAIIVSSIADTVHCARDSFNLSFDATGTYNIGNVFSAEISNENGVFAVAPPVIGTKMGTVSDSIRCALPSHFTTGSGYRVRVKSSNTVVTGEASFYTLDVYDRPFAQTITGDSNVNANFSYPYSVPAVTASTWAWIAPAATITQTANSANLFWNTVGQPQVIKVIETNQYGCIGDTSSKNVNVYPLKITQVTPSSLTPCPDGAVTVGANASGVYYSGNTFTAQLSNATGSFAAPVSIGTLSLTTQPVGNAQPITVNARLPYPLANGSNYRIRIVSSNFAVISDTSAAVTVNKPDLGADQSRMKCPGFPVDLTTVFTTTGLTINWNVARPDSVVASGIYQLIVTNANGCKDTALVTVTNYPKPGIGPDLTRSKCVGFTYNLTSLYTDVALTYSWNTATPSAVDVGTYTVIATNSNGCRDTAVVTITNYPQPVPAFTINSSSQCISGNSFAFTNTSTIGGGTMTYQWSFGDNSSSSAANPAHSYTSAGVYTVKLIATNNNGCKDSVAQTITVNLQPVSQFTINNGSQCLSGNSFVFTNTSSVSSGTMTYQWSFGDNTTSTSASPSHAYSIAGTFSVKLVVTSSSGCKDSATQNVTVNAQPTANFAAGNATQCVKGNSFAFTSLSTISSGTISGYQWSFGDNTSSSSASPTHTYAAAGVYNVKLIVTSNSGCKDSVSKAVTVNASPDLGADKSITVSCAGGTANITTLYNTSAFSSVIYSAVNPQQAAVGSYTLMVCNSSGCTDTTVITVLDASVASVATSTNNSMTANRECTDTQGWTNYYNDNGTPADFSDDIRVLSVKKNGNSIGTVGDGTFSVKVAATQGAGSSHAVKVNSPLVTAGTSFYSMNRYWNITPTIQPATPVNIRFYYNTQDLTDVNGDYPGGPVSHTQLNMYKLQAGNPDPTTNWAGAASVTYLQNGSTPGATSWVYTSLGNNTHQAEFQVTNFSGGGAGAVSQSVLPVTFVKFDVVAQNNKVQLLWSTTTEVNSKTFEVQRSLDGSSFETLATVAAAGSSTTLRNYYFNDEKVIQFSGSTLFYRILQTELNGQKKFTDIKSVRIAQLHNLLTLQFNPVNSFALMKYECQEKDKVQIRILDQMGKLVVIKEVFVDAGTNQIHIETNRLAKGIYEVELISLKDHQHVRMMKE